VIRAKFAGRSGVYAAPFPPKPRRMRWKTYRALQCRYEALSNLWCLGMSEFVDGLCERIGVNTS
jgi:hypothetical protein